jgi:hypothetical protein
VAVTAFSAVDYSWANRNVFLPAEEE